MAHLFVYFRIDHWDNEREKVVMLTENSLLIYKYNFINNQVDDFSRVSLHIIDTIQIGDFHYPEWSVMPLVSIFILVQYRTNSRYHRANSADQDQTASEEAV